MTNSQDANPVGDESEFDRGYRLGNRDGQEFGREHERRATVQRIRERLLTPKDYTPDASIFAVLDEEVRK